MSPQLPGKKGSGPSGWTIQAKLQMYLWLGVSKHKKEVLKGLPLGYEDTVSLRRSCRIVGTPPETVKYEGMCCVGKTSASASVSLVVSFSNVYKITW